MAGFCAQTGFRRTSEFDQLSSFDRENGGQSCRSKATDFPMFIR